MTPEETLKIKSLTNRSDVFNHVVEHLRKQGCQSLFSQKNMCAYRGDGGTMCAVGALITDEEYSPSMENNSISVLFEKDLLHPDLKKRVEPNLKMLSELQVLHDNHLEFNNGVLTEYANFKLNDLREKWGIK